MKRIGLLAALLMIGTLAFTQNVPFSIGEWSPYTGEKLPNGGAVSELVAAACKAADMNATFKFFPWPRAEKDVTDGTAFATFPYQMVAGDTIYIYSDPLIKGVFKVFYNSKNPKIKAGFMFKTLADLKGLKVASVAGYAKVVDDLKKAGLDTDNTPDIEAAFKKLDVMRVDIVIEDQAAGFAVIKSVAAANFDNFKVFDTPYGDAAGNKYFLKVSKVYKDAQTILDKFNQGLKKIQKNGEYGAIIKKYNMVGAQ